MKIIRDIKQAADFLSDGSALTIGTFDGIHVGHDVLIKKLMDVSNKKKLKSALITFSPHPRLIVAPYSAPYLLSTEKEKLKLLENYNLDALIVIKFDEALSRITATEFLQQYLFKSFSCQVMVIGYNHAFGYQREGNIEFLQANSNKYGFEVEVTDPVIYKDEPVHSSRIRNEILHGNYDDSLEMLGHSFEMSGIVVEGKGLGKKLGFPTINVKIPDNKIVPQPGVYKAETIINSDKYQGMMYIPPEIQDFAFEVNLFNFTGNLYKQEVSVYPKRFIRKPIKFDNKDALIEQIANDEKKIKEIYKLQKE